MEDCDGHVFTEGQCGDCHRCGMVRFSRVPHGPCPGPARISGSGREWMGRDPDPDDVPPEWDAEVAAPDTRPARRGFLRRLIANLRRVFTTAPCHNAPGCKGTVRVERGTRVDGIYCPICRLPGPQPDRRFT